MCENNLKSKIAAVFSAVLAAALYAITVPFSKYIMPYVTPVMLAGLMYFGAGTGIGATMLFRRASGKAQSEQLLEKKDLPYVIAMVILDIAAPIFLMFGISLTASANVSLLNNFEIVATTAIAYLIFKEKISPRLTVGIILVVISSLILGFDGSEGFTINIGSVLVICASLCWGFENNCTRKISDKSSDEIVLIKGLFSGAGSIVVAIITGEHFPSLLPILIVLLVGFITYGLSIKFYIMAQASLGASKTSAFYSTAPFLGVGFSFIILGEKPSLQFYIALAVMVLSTAVVIYDTLSNDVDKNKIISESSD